MEGEEFGAALQSALGQLAPEEAQSVLEQLTAADLISGGESAGPDMARVLREFDPLLRGIAAIAKGDDEPRAQIEAVLVDLEEKGWHLTTSVQRIWAGERDAAVLTAGLDDQDAQFVRHILELIA